MNVSDSISPTNMDTYYYRIEEYSLSTVVITLVLLWCCCIMCGEGVDVGRELGSMCWVTLRQLCHFLPFSRLKGETR